MGDGRARRPTAAADNDDAGRRSAPFVVAVDGPAASGKGTLARRLAAAFNLRYLDTGLLYRAVGAEALRAGVALDDGPSVAAVARALDLGRASEGASALRTDAAAQAASRVSALPAVRAALLQAQRDFASGAAAAAAADGGGGGGGGGGRGAVLDGRDIGTVVCPSAAAKLFVTASAEVRAGRRFLELQERRRREAAAPEEGGGGPAEGGGGAEEEEEPTLARVLRELRARDARDASRAASPLRAAEGALVLDTTAMGADAAFEAARAYVEGVRAARAR